MKSGEAVQDLRRLKGMERAGVITLHPHTGTKVSWYFGELTAWYVEDASTVPFEYKGHIYRGQYFSGCFYPFVVYVGERGETNV